MHWFSHTHFISLLILRLVRYLGDVKYNNKCLLLNCFFSLPLVAWKLSVSSPAAFAFITSSFAFQGHSFCKVHLHTVRCPYPILYPLFFSAKRNTLRRTVCNLFFFFRSLELPAHHPYQSHHCRFSSILSGAFNADRRSNFSASSASCAKGLVTSTFAVSS